MRRAHAPLSHFSPHTLAEAEALSLSALGQFESGFATELAGASAALTAAEGHEDADAALRGVSEKIASLHALVASAASDLPLAIREASLAKVSGLEAGVKAARERLASRKKFAFKNRKKVAAAAAQRPQGRPLGGPDSLASEKRRNRRPVSRAVEDR